MTSAAGANDDSHAVRRPTTWLVLAAILLIPAAVAFVVSSTRTPLYAARVEFVVNSAQQNDQSASSTVANLESLLDTRSMMEGMEQESGVDVDTFESRFRHERVGDSNVLRLTISDPRPDRALSLAKDARRVFLRLTSNVNSGQPAVTFLQGQLKSVRDRQANVQKKLVDLSSATDLASTEQARQLRNTARALDDEAVALRTSLVEERAREAQQAASVVALGQPYALEKPISPNPSRAGAAGLVAGIALCAGFLTARSLRRRPESDGTSASTGG